MVRSLPDITCMGEWKASSIHIQFHHMCLQEYASLLRVQALEQRLAIIKAELKDDSTSEEGPPGGPEPMQEA